VKKAPAPEAALTAALEQRLAMELARLRVALPLEHVIAAKFGYPKTHDGPITHAYPYTWTAELPLPCTAADALTVVERDSADIVQHMTTHIVETARAWVAPEMLQAVLARIGIITDRWMWPTAFAGGRIAFHALELLQLAAMKDHDDPSNRLWIRWPGEAAPLDVMKWARGKMNALRPGCGDDLVKQAEAQMFPQVKDAHDDAVTIPSTFHLALLFMAEREVREGQRRRSIAIDASKAHHGMLTGMRDLPKNGKPQTMNTDKGRMELLAPGHDVQLTLPIEGTSEALVHAIRDWRSWFGLRNWAAIQRLLSVEGKREGWVRWTLDTHMAALGYDLRGQRDFKKRQRVAKEVELLTEMELAIYDNDGHERERAPLVHVGKKFDRLHGSEWRLEGMELRINSAVYRGVRTSNGSLGSNWQPAPIELAHVDDVHHPYTLALGLVLPIRWRWAQGDGNNHVELTGANVLELAGIRYRSTHPAEAWNALDRDLAELQRIGGLGQWQWKRDKHTLAGVMELHPPEWALDRTLRKLTPIEPSPPPPILTGAELAKFRKGRGWTQEQAAKELGVGIATLKRAEAKPDVPMGPALTKALRPKV